MRFLISLLICLCFGGFGMAQSDNGYTLFNAKGKKVAYKKMIKGLEDGQVILFGEYHDNPISHWLEYEVTKSLAAKYKLTLGAEMFERDNQDELELYLSDSINHKGLDTMARLWNNYKTDYKPLVDFAKDSSWSFVGTNIPRRFASLVYKKDFDGLDSLTNEEKSWIAPLPIPFDSSLSQYQAILTMMGGHGSPRIVKAQAIKDATMAHFILAHFDESEDARFVHYNGSFHSDFHQGIMWYLQQYKPEIRVKTIATVSQDDVSKLNKEHLGRADYIICVDEDMTKTY